MNGPEQPLNPLVDAGDFTVRLTPENVERFPGVRDAIAGFDAGPLPAAQAATEWLQSLNLDRPLESAVTLFFLDGALVGFYALANAEVELTMKRRTALGLSRRTQPAVLLTWIARSARHDFDGTELVAAATYQALRAAEHSAATLLALDPFDEATAAMWRQKHGFADSAAPGPGRTLPRMIIPLRRPDG